MVTITTAFSGSTFTVQNMLHNRVEGRALLLWQNSPACPSDNSGIKAKVREYGALVECYGRDKTDVPFSENILSQYSFLYISHNTGLRSDRYSLQA